MADTKGSVARVPVVCYTGAVSAEEIFVGLGLTLLLAVASQICADRLRVPAIVVLLPVGFVAGQFISQLDPEALLGDTFSPLVGLAVALILFDGGLDLRFTDLEGHSRQVVRRLLLAGIPITGFATAAMAYAWLGVSYQVALMLGAILVVSGPTVVTPLLEAARPGGRLSSILAWEGTTIDPIGAILGALTFQAIVGRVEIGQANQLLAFARSVTVGMAGGALGSAVLWVLLTKVRLRGVLATQAIVAVVVGVAALCNALRDETGLIAAIGMGVALANLSVVDLPEDRRFFTTIVQLVIGVLFISISATVPASAVGSVLVPTIALVAVLVVVVRPVVSLIATRRTSLSWQERAFIAWMAPRGIVAASTAATFAAPLVAAGFSGAVKLLPVTFVVIVATVSLYGLTAHLAVRVLGLGERCDNRHENGGSPIE